MTVYWLDADVCIQSKNEETGAYPFSRMGKFWAYLSHQVDSGIVKAPLKVYEEISQGNDQLAEWFRDREDRGLCIKPTPDVWDCVGKISDFVEKRWKDRKARMFLDGADCFVLAHAKAMGSDGVVVSAESLRKQNSIVKIPAVCGALEIEKITIFQMLNRLGATF